MVEQHLLPGRAILEYHRGHRGSVIRTRINGRPDQPMNPALFFRPFREMKAYEKEALRRCRGHILDIGAGAGSHSLVLQRRGHTVTALERSVEAAQVITERGVHRVLCKDIMDIRNQRFDTLLLLMNGLGLAGTLDATKKLLRKMTNLLSPGGQIIGDSSDILFYHVQSGRNLQDDRHYYGEVLFELSYRGKKETPLPWVYLDPGTLAEICREVGLSVTIVQVNSNGHYLAVLERK